MGTPAGVPGERDDAGGRPETAGAFARGAGVASIGVATAGLVSYAYFALASHALDAAAYGRITLLWSAVFITVSILYRPVEQLLARSVADREARGVPERRALRVAARVQLGVAAAFTAAALALRGPIEDGLFGGSATLFWIMVATVLAYAGGYFARGVLAGRRRFGSYGALLLLESCTRASFVVAVAVGIASGESVVALGMAVGPAVSLAVILAAARTGARGGQPDPRSRAMDTEMTLAHGAGYAAGVLLIMASEQAFLTAGPLLLNATEAAAGAAVAGFAFNAILIVRAPLQLFQSVQAAILPHLTRLRAGGHSDPFHRSVGLTLATIAGFAAIVTLALLAVGPEVMGLLFGDEFDYSRGGLALMGIGMGLYLGSATLTQAALARGRAPRAAMRWVAAAAVFVALLLALDLEDRVLEVEVAFAGGALFLFALLLTLYRRGDRLAG